jgi:hypothetical protein
MQKLSEEYEP